MGIDDSALQTIASTALWLLVAKFAKSFDPHSKNAESHGDFRYRLIRKFSRDGPLVVLT